MRQKVIAKQPNSKMCLVCGLRNVAGLKAQFYEIESSQLLAIFRPSDHHQGYPQRLHGGVAAAILDETIGRSICIGSQKDIWGVTIDLHTRFREPIPLNEPLRVLARVTHQTRRHFEGTGELLLPDGRVAVEARGKYLRMPLDRLQEFDPVAQQWRVVSDEDDPEHVEIPDAAPSRRMPNQ